MNTASMTEQLISFETAVLAKEKGFDWPCRVWAWAQAANKESWSRPDFDSQFADGKLMSNHPNTPGIITRPTQSLLQRWLREKHNWSVEINSPDGKSGKWHYGVHKPFGFGDHSNKSSVGYDTYEQALEAGLLEALKLIK